MSIQLIEVKRGFTVFTSLPLKVRLMSLLSANSFGCEVPVVIKLTIPAQFFNVNVFKAILSIQRFFNLTEYRELIVEIICSLGMQEWRFEFDTGCSND